MPAEVVQDFPLFPLGLVALPHEHVPLHIFEPRYRTMFAHCIETESEFGIVWSDEHGESRAIGCAMDVTRVLEELDDGRLNVLTTGTRPFRVVEETEALPYPAGTVEFLEDRDEELDEDVLEAAHEAYRALVAEATDHDPQPREVEELDAYAMAATVDFGLEAKQALLDLRSETARLKLVTRLFRAATRRLEFVERAQVRARSNGKVRFG